MKKINYFSITFCFLIFFLNNCSFLKDDKKTDEDSRPIFVETRDRASQTQGSPHNFPGSLQAIEWNRYQDDWWAHQAAEHPACSQSP